MQKEESRLKTCWRCYFFRKGGRDETGDVLAVLFFPVGDEGKGRDLRCVSGVIFPVEDEGKGGWRRVSGVIFPGGGGGRAKGREETGVVFAVLFFTVADEEKEGCVDRRAVNEET